MAASIGLNTGLRALLSSRFVLDTIGHNLANATTPGYSRQAVDLGAGKPLFSSGVLVGTGVDARSVRRTVDALLQRRLVAQTSVRGLLQARFTGLSEIEALFREPEDSSLGARLDSFFGSVSSLSTNPGDSILRTGMVSSAAQLAGQFGELTSSLSSIRRDTVREVYGRVEEVNDLGREISSLNREISSIQSTGLSANDLLDRRDLALAKLSELVDVTTVVNAQGAVRVLVGGNTLVSETQFHAMRASEAPNASGSASISLEIQGAAGKLGAVGGVLGGLVALSQSSIPSLQAKLDGLARNLIHEVNRVHSTGIPAGGPYTSLVASNAFVDVDADGSFRDELLSNAGLPFDVASGELFVNVTDSASGTVSKHGIPISRTHTTVGAFIDALSDVPHLSAGVDALGRLQIVSDTGFGFDFSRRVVPAPDALGSFGGAQASLASATAGPFALTAGDTLDLDVAGTPVSIVFQGSDFADIANASAEEIAAVIGADPLAQANGITASVVAGRLLVQSVGSGTGASFGLTGGTAAGALGWTGLVGSTVTGHANAVSVAISGSYSGGTNQAWTFRAAQDGAIGTTPGLTVDVVDGSGKLVATLDVGAGYVPGSPLAVTDGISVSFGLGEISAAHNDVFALDVLHESDTAGVLAAAGLASFFTGTTASDIAVAAGIELDPTRIASSLSGAPGDNGGLLALIDVQGLALGELGGASLGESYGDLIGRLGFEVASTAGSLDANEALMQSLELRQEQVSGVNVDEELVDLLRFEQAFQAASRYIDVLNQLNDDLLDLL